MEFHDHHANCLTGQDPNHVCAPTQCRIDNDYSHHCDVCLCASCTRSDCHKETFDTFTVECFECARACKVEFQSTESEGPDRCLFDPEKLVVWEFA